MPDAPDVPDEIVIQTYLDARHGWIIVPVDIADTVRIEMVLDTGSPLSALGDPVRQMLMERGLLTTDGGRRGLLRHVSIHRQPLPDLPVRQSRRVSQVGASGVLGLDFLAQFTTLSFHMPSMRLTLRR